MQCPDCGGLSRRQFLKKAAAGIVDLAGAAAAPKLTDSSETLVATSASQISMRSPSL